MRCCLSCPEITGKKEHEDDGELFQWEWKARRRKDRAKQLFYTHKSNPSLPSLTIENTPSSFLWLFVTLPWFHLLWDQSRSDSAPSSLLGFSDPWKPTRSPHFHIPRKPIMSLNKCPKSTSYALQALYSNFLVCKRVCVMRDHILSPVLVQPSTLKTSCACCLIALRSFCNDLSPFFRRIKH